MSATPKPVVLIHGLIGHLRERRILDAVPGPVLAPDLLGYGEHAAVAIPGTGHLMMLEDPKAFGAVLTRLLAQDRLA